jgi:hypothetical protein
MDPNTTSLVVENRLGIGTAFPAYPLHVRSTLTNQLLRLESTTGGAVMHFYDTTNNQNWEVGANSAGYYVYDIVGGVYGLRMQNSTGRVGIGVAPSSYKLDVQTSSGSYAINALNTAANSAGVYGQGSQYGLRGNSLTGVRGDGTNYGLYGTSNTCGSYGSGATYGVYGISGAGTGVWGQGSSNDFAGPNGLVARLGTWYDLSDRNFKENFSTVDDKTILKKICNLPIRQWNYTFDKNRSKHVGPTAQDFYAAFGLGENEKLMAKTDSVGVALVGIKALNQIVKEQEKEIAALKAEIESLKNK